MAPVTPNFYRGVKRLVKQCLTEYHIRRLRYLSLRGGLSLLEREDMLSEVLAARVQWQYAAQRQRACERAGVVTGSAWSPNAVARRCR